MTNATIFNIFDKVYIIGERGCSLYETDKSYKEYLTISRNGIITKMNGNRVLIHNGTSEMWFYNEDIKKRI